MYKIAICDDDKRYRKTIREIVEHENSLPENEIRFYEYESGNELLKHTDILHELVFIDIRMPGLDGNQTALKLRNYNKDAVLIFCSSYFEPTVDSINFGQPFRYIMKDLHDTSLRREIAAIMTEVKRRFLNDYAVTVTSAGKIIRIYVENILYVSRAKRGCEITIVKEQEKETVRCREAFGELYEQLKDQGFAQAHYSYIVNLGKVEGLEKGVLRLFYIKYAEESTDDNPVVIAKGIDENGKEFEEKININDIDLRNASYVEMSALEAYYDVDRGNSLSSFPQETGHMGLNERCDLISSFEKVIQDMNKLGKYDLQMFYMRNMNTYLNLERQKKA